MILRSLVDSLAAVWTGRSFSFACPLCQRASPRRAEWRGEIRPGQVQLCLIKCRRCGPQTERIVEAAGLKLKDILWKGSKREIEEEWRKATGGRIVVKEHDKLDHDLTNRVYSYIINNDSLMEEHEDWLKERGISRHLAREFGYTSWPVRSVTLLGLHREFGDDLLRVPGFVKRDGDIFPSTGKAFGIAFPCRDRDGKIFALKIRYPKSVSAKYLTLSSAPNGPPGEAGVHWPWGIDSQTATGLRVVEGERKADYAWWETEYPTISIPGVGMGRLLVEELKACPWIKRVYLAMDRDAAGRLGAIQIAMQIADMVDVSCEVWDEQYKGIDDAILAGAERQVISDDSWLDM